jgi:hypothetical protein
VFFGDHIHSSDEPPYVGTLISQADHPELFVAANEWTLICRKKKGDHQMFGCAYLMGSDIYYVPSVSTCHCNLFVSNL